MISIGTQQNSKIYTQFSNLNMNQKVNSSYGKMFTLTTKDTRTTLQIMKGKQVILFTMMLISLVYFLEELQLLLILIHGSLTTATVNFAMV